ncbi:outer membrane lipoprotein carrier protein LolA [Christiangramia sp. OXR-203]|jgi:outer membrane lipoprotein carrier protein|uniref:LolA family protein n=1 Tax=Christiangramia sp. OXR-203 TaxID=3100176 RepID=UPI002AC8C4B8|nr:outer membrane lipoprotein carrier protein LolA [Christiangramia sp. OXR-203]WPY97096.1 outer membrane lipoprotein carrier protein LolA [Christiangramia sp. OXR-203]
MRILKFIFILFSCQLFAQNATFSTSEAKAFKESVSSKAKTIENLQADFRQLKFMKTMEKTIESDGHIWYASPGKLKWSYTSPYDYELLFKDSSLYITVDGKTRKMNTGNSELFEKMGELVAGSFNGRILEMDELFETDFAREGKFVKVTVTPMDENLAEMFSEIWIFFNVEKYIEKVKLMEPSGDYTEIKMSNFMTNQKIPASVFQLK